MAGKKVLGKAKEPLCEDLAGEGCGLKKVINIIGGKWKKIILVYCRSGRRSKEASQKLAERHIL